MNKEVIGLIVGTIVIFILYLCDLSSLSSIRSWVRLLPSVQERLSAIAVVRGIHPIVECTRWMDCL